VDIKWNINVLTDPDTCSLSGTWAVITTEILPDDSRIEEVFTGTLSAFGTPPTGGELSWSTNDGAFDMASNWEPARVPTTSDDASFGEGGVSRVTLPTLAESKSLDVVRGDMTLVGGRWNVVGTSPSDVKVGSSSSDPAILSLEGTVLTSVGGDIGSGTGSNGAVNVDDTGSSWLMSGALTVGNEGVGDLLVSNGGRVVSADLNIGMALGSEGAVSIHGFAATKGSTLQLVADEITVGVQGDAKFTVSGGAEVQAEALFIAQELTGIRARGLATITDSATALTVVRDITVEGVLSIQETAEVTSDSALVGSSNVGSFDGAVNVGFSGMWDVEGALTVGDPPDGAGNQTILTTGGLYVHNGGVIASGTLYVQRESFLQGNGLIHTITATLPGTVQPGRVDAILGGIKQTGATGTLTIDGNIMMDGGIIEIDAMGLTDGTFDKLVVTGNSDITNATIRMNFIEGFLPTTGDQIPFLEVAGISTMTNLSLEFSGVADGFDYEVTESGGMLVFEALNDAQALQQPGVGCSAEGGGRASSTDSATVLVAGLLLILAGRLRTWRTSRRNST
jgi:T5SS/PEP-CTERM-associated repeat protein